MIRQTIDEYLDGALDATGRAEVERTLASDPAASRLLAQMKAERAVRTAVYASYTPTTAEAVTLAEQVLDAAVAPVGRVGNHAWIRITAGVAAGLVIAAGAFGFGRVTAPAQVVTNEVTDLAVVSQSDVEVRHFRNNREGYQNFVQQQLDQFQRAKNPSTVSFTDETSTPNRL